MAEFQNKKLEKTNVNQGQEFKNGDGVRATDINALVSGILYNTEKVQSMGYYEKKENVEITDGQIIVGGTASEKYNQAFITDEKVGVEDPYNVNYALLQLNETNIMTSEQLGPTLRLSKSFLSAIDDYPYNYLKLPKKNGTLATLDDVGGGGAIIHEDVNFPNAVTEKTFYDIVGQPEQTHILNGCAVLNIFANVGFNVVYQLPDSTNLTIYNYGVAADDNGLHQATQQQYYDKKANVNIDWNGVIVYHNTDGIVSGTKFEGKQITSTNYTTGETGVLKIPQNKDGTLALDEDVEKKADKDYVFVNEIVLEEDSKEVVLNTDSAGNDLSGYSELLVIFSGKFTMAFTEKPIYLRFNDGAIYQSYENATANDVTKFYFKTWKINKQYIGYIDKYFFQCNYMQGFCKKTNMEFSWQGLQDQNANMKYDSCMAAINWNKMRFGSKDADVTIAAGSKLLVLGKE